MRLDSEGLFIQVSGITSEADALFAVALGANAVAFDFGPTSRQVSTSLVHDIVRRLPTGVVTVGCFRSEMPERVVEITNTLGLSVAQVGGALSAVSLRYVTDRVRTVVRAVRTPEEAYAHDVDEGVDYLLMPDSERREDLEASRSVLSDPLVLRPVIVSGLGPSTVGEFVARYDPWGVDALGAIESAPGVKDGVRMGEFIAQAREARQRLDEERPSTESD